MVWGRRSVLWDGQRSPGSYQIVTGVMRKTAGFAQSAGGAHAEQRQKRGQEKKMKAETLGLDSSEGNRNSILSFRYRWKQTSQDQYVRHPPTRSDLSFSILSKVDLSLLQDFNCDYTHNKTLRIAAVEIQKEWVYVNVKHNCITHT